MTTPVTLLTQADCHLCERAKQVFDRVRREFPLTITEVGFRTTEGHQLATEAGVLFAPGVLLDGEPFAYGRLSERKLRKNPEHPPHPGAITTKELAIDTLYLLALLACPVGMGLMMWFMMRGQHGDKNHTTDQKHEIGRLRSEVDYLQQQASKNNRPG